jgi:hypothetical protein
MPVQMRPTFLLLLMVISVSSSSIHLEGPSGELNFNNGDNRLYRADSETLAISKSLRIDQDLEVTGVASGLLRYKTVVCSGHLTLTDAPTMVPGLTHSFIALEDHTYEIHVGSLRYQGNGLDTKWVICRIMIDDVYATGAQTGVSETGSNFKSLFLHWIGTLTPGAHTVTAECWTSCTTCSAKIICESTNTASASSLDARMDIKELPKGTELV